MCFQNGVWRKRNWNVSYVKGMVMLAGALIASTVVPRIRRSF